MKKLKVLLALMIFTLVATDCGKDPIIIDQNNPPSTELIITIEDQYETPPSRVSMFFKVETTDGEPVSGLTEDDFNIYEKGRNDDDPLLLSADEATRKISDNGEIFKYYTILLLDLSGSVLNNSLEQTKSAAKAFVEDVLSEEDGNAENHLGVWWFDGQDALHPLINFTRSKTALNDAIDGINSNISEDTSTDLFGAILKSTTLAKGKLTESELQGILSAVSIITFTDGTDQAARYSREEAYEAVDTAPENIHYYTIGLGSEIDETVLNRLGTDSSVFADDTEALTTKFEEIAGLIYQEANSYYLFEYCTPKRDGSGDSELHMHVEKDNKKGQKITTFNATGFYDDCDLN